MYNQIHENAGKSVAAFATSNNAASRIGYIGKPLVPFEQSRC